MNIPLPQDTRLYEVQNGQIIEPKLSVLSLSSSGNNNVFNDLQDRQFLFSLMNQNNSEMNIYLTDKNISCTRSTSYFALNGFDTGFDCRFLNISSPTVCFFPLVKAQDLGENITLTSIAANTYTLNNYTAYLSNTLEENDLVLLKNQTTNSENVLYRVTDITGSTVTLYNDILDTESLNSILSQDQDYIFTRVKVSDDDGDFYYGLYNTGGYYWVPQTKGLRLPDADYGISLDNELGCNELAVSLFSSVELALNNIIAINVLTDGGGSTGGKSSGLYAVRNIANSTVFLEPIYPSYVFIHQFFRVKYNINTLTSDEIWFVNHATTTSSNYIYGGVKFNFLKMDISSVLADPINWAKQVGGRYDSIIGITLYTDLINNNYIRNTDIFSFSIKPPTWTSNTIEGFALTTAYDTNMLGVEQQAIGG